MLITHSTDMATQTETTMDEDYEIISAADGQENTTNSSQKPINEQPQPAKPSEQKMKVKRDPSIIVRLPNTHGVVNTRRSPSAHLGDMATQIEHTREENDDIISSPSGHDDTEAPNNGTNNSHKQTREQPQSAKSSDLGKGVPCALSIIPRFPNVHEVVQTHRSQTHRSSAFEYLVRKNAIDELTEELRTLRANFSEVKSVRQALKKDTSRDDVTHRAEQSLASSKAAREQAEVTRKRILQQLSERSDLASQGAKEPSNEVKSHENPSQQPHFPGEDVAALRSQIAVLTAQLAKAESKNNEAQSRSDNIDRILFTVAGINSNPDGTPTRADLHRLRGGLRADPGLAEDFRARSQLFPGGQEVRDILGL